MLNNGGMETEGVFRRAGDQGDVNDLVESLSGGDYSTLEGSCDPLVVADVLKIFIRGVRPPLIPSGLYEQVKSSPRAPPRPPTDPSASWPPTRSLLQTTAGRSPRVPPPI